MKWPQSGVSEMAKPHTIANIDFIVAGIPCQIGLTYRFVQKPLGPSADSDLDAAGYTDEDWIILDRRGYHAKWLEKKLTPELECNAAAAIDEYYQEQARWAH